MMTTCSLMRYIELNIFILTLYNKSQCNAIILLFVQMLKVLKDKVKGANALMLLMNGEEERFDASFQQMVREMQAMFGNTMWEYIIIGKICCKTYVCEAIHDVCCGKARGSSQYLVIKY